MKTKCLHTITLLFLIIGAFGQNPTLELTYTAVDSAAYTQLDSIRVMNLTQGGDTVLFWPDTTLVLNLQVGIFENNQNSGTFQVFHSYPNPVIDRATISLQIPEKDKVMIILADQLGRIIVKNTRVLDAGKHTFSFSPGSSNLYFFTAFYRTKSNSISVLNAGNQKIRECSLEYIGSEINSPFFKASGEIRNFDFYPGDELLCIGYHDTLQSAMLESPLTSDTCTFQFAANIPCPGMPTVVYDGRTYNTVQIFSQCWLKDNLNTGAMIGGGVEMTNNGILEKYCYNTDTNNCTTYGGLYQWNEMMQYATQEGIQGICPEGWHIPTDTEWKILEGAADSQYRIGDEIWDSYGLRGYDAGLHLKSTHGWYNAGNGLDLYGFSGLPGGYRYHNGDFQYKHQHGLWWSSTEGNITSAWNRYLSHNNSKVDRDYGNNKIFSFSVRCIRNN